MRRSAAKSWSGETGAALDAVSRRVLNVSSSVAVDWFLGLAREDQDDLLRLLRSLHQRRIARVAESSASDLREDPSSREATQSRFPVLRFPATSRRR